MQRRLTVVWSWPPRIQRRAWRQLVNSTQIAVDDVCRRIAFRLIGGEEMSRLIGQNGRDMLAVHEETRKKRSGMGGPRETTVAHVSVPRWRNLMEQWGWWRRRRASGSNSRALQSMNLLAFSHARDTPRFPLSDRLASGPVDFISLWLIPLFTPSLRLRFDGYLVYFLSLFFFVPLSSTMRERE